MAPKDPARRRGVSRRTFLKLGAAAGAAGGLTLPQAARAFDVARRTPSQPPPDSVVPTFCDICFWKCGVLAEVTGGAVTMLRGLPDSPLNHGRLCARGNGGVKLLYDPLRLKTPLIRTGPRGRGQWRPASWDEALDLAALRLGRIRDRYGAEAIAGLTHGLGGGFFHQLLLGMGSPNLAEPSFAQCRGPRDVAFQLTFGEGIGSPERVDMPNARCLVLLGNHLGENCHNGQVQDLVAARAAGARLVVVDPRLSTPASKADLWLPIRPGTDLALLLAWIRLLIEEDWYDREFVERHCIGLSELRAAVAGATVEWAAAETGLEASAIVQAARYLAEARPAALVHPGRHVTWYGDDTQRLRAVAILTALLGAWGARGGYILPRKLALADYPAPEFPGSLRDHVDAEAGCYRFADEVTTTGIRDATLTGKPYPIKGWVVFGTNLVKALPDYRRTLAAADQLDFLLAIDIIASETVKLADVVLPECTYLERYDELYAPAAAPRPFVALRQPVIPPMHDSKPAWWIARELAERLGVGRYFPWRDIEEYLDHRLRSAGTSLVEMKRTGIFFGPAFEPYLAPGAAAKFKTPSGKIELHSEPMAQAGFDPVPRYQAPEQRGPGWYRLLYGRSPAHTYGRTQNNALLLDLVSTNPVWLHPDEAARLGLAHGQKVWLENQDGLRRGPYLLKLTRRMNHDSVYMVHGFGLGPLKAEEPLIKCSCDVALVTGYAVDPVMGGTGMRVNFVRFADGPGEEA